MVGATPTGYGGEGGLKTPSSVIDDEEMVVRMAIK